MTAQTTIARGGVRSIVFRALQGSVDFLVVVVTARAFGAEGRGLYALASLAASFAVIPMGGASVPLAAEVAHRREPVRRLVGASVLLAAAGGGAVSAVLLVAAAAGWPGLRLLALVALAVPFLVLGIYQQELYRALGDVRRMSYLYAWASVVSLAALGCSALAAPGRIWVALLVWAAAQALVPLVTLALQRRETGIELAQQRPLLRRLARRGAGVAAGTAMARLNYRVDVFVVAALLPVADVGRYSVAVAVGEALWQLSRAVLTGAYSRLIGEPDGGVALAARVVRHVVLLLVVGGALAVVLARLVLPEVLGGDFRHVWLPLALLVPGIVALGTAEVLQAFMLVRLERTREYLVGYAGAAAVNLVGAVALVPFIGVAGAALATSVSYAVGSAYLFSRFAALAGGAPPLRAYVPGGRELGDYRRLVGSLRRRPLSRTPA